MAVYTTLTEFEISNLLSRFALPTLHSFQGASSGVENTTYFLTLNSGTQYVLTVFENFSPPALSPYIQLITQLHLHGLPVPCPLTDRHGVVLQTIVRKPALLFVRMPGKHVEDPEPEICKKLGINLAKIHDVTSAAPLRELTLVNPCGLAWMKETLALVSDSLDKAEIKILQEQIDLSADFELRDLPRAIIHGDLFRDNVLTHKGTITALIDFYNAGKDVALIDLAITANDWCYAQNDAMTSRRLAALLDGYQMVRPLDSLEISSWRDSLTIAAARLWLSRQKRLILARRGGKDTVKNPFEYQQILLQHLNHP